MNTPETELIELPLEEKINSLTHGFGFLLSVVALVILVVFASLYGTVWHVASFSLFGAALVCLYLASSLYHALRREKLKRFFLYMDHAAIYLLIAGTYTPFTLVGIRHQWGWLIFGIVWGLAVTGIIITLFFFDRFERLSLILYLLMGWLVAFSYRPFLDNLDSWTLLLVILGGISYTVGVAFYLWRRLPFSHALWHLFVIGGSTWHFFAVLSLL